MINGPLADRLEYAILAIIMGHVNGSHQAFWGVWMNSVLKLVPDLSDEVDLRAAFKRLLGRQNSSFIESRQRALPRFRILR